MWVRTNGGSVIGEIAHLAGMTGGQPLLKAVVVVQGNGARHSGEFKSAMGGELTNFIRRQISSPTDRMSSMALLLRTTPGRMT